MPENDRLNGCLDEIDLEFVEREATPRLLMKLSIQLHLAGLSLSNTVSILEVFGVKRARSTVHNWVHKADLQSISTVTADQLAVNEKMIRLHGQEFWLYGAVDPHTNEILHVRLFSTANKQTTRWFLTDLHRRYQLDDVVFLVDDADYLAPVLAEDGYRFQVFAHGNRNAIKLIF